MKISTNKPSIVNHPSNTTALVVLSGGADSCICLHWALERYTQVETITFDYGQRHLIEIDAARSICEKMSLSHKVVPLNSFSALGGNALNDSHQTIESDNGRGLPTTFVPGRNLIFLSLAAAWAYQIGAQHLVTGVCETDYSGYPDCREKTIQSLQKTISLGMEYDIEIHTPLMHLSKAESIHLAHKLGAFETLALSHTCYEGDYPPCGACPSCVLRKKGFDEAGFPDPLLTRSALQASR